MDLIAAIPSFLILLPVLLALGRRRQHAGGDRLLAGATTTVLLAGTGAALVAAALLPEARRVLVWDASTWFGLSEHALAAGFLIDRLGLIMAALVGVVGAATTAFAGRYLAGDPARGSFLRWFAVTIAAAQVLVLSANLAQLALAWLLVSAGLHRLLIHHAERARAQLAARSKFVISRLGDLALLGVMAVLLPAAGTLDLLDLANAAGSSALATALPLAAAGLMVAAMCKSAQVPFHVWLPDTLEAPTPVSALMHAGIINAGGFLLIRCGELLAQVPAVLDALVIVGLLTAAIGILAMWAQTDVKKALAWSTVGQMGFMVLQCGLGAFAAALIHLIGHAGYKAHAFLRSGSPVAALAAPPGAQGRAGATLGFYLLAATAATGLVVFLQHLDGQQHAGGPILALAVGLALAQVWTAGTGSLITRTALVAALAAVTVPGLAAVHAWLHLPVAAEPFARGASGIAVGSLAVFSLLGLALLSVMLPWLASRWTSLRVHARDGWYVGILVERLIRRCWPLSNPVRGDLS